MKKCFTSLATVALSAGLLIYSQPVAADCSFCGAAFCLKVELGQRVTATRPTVEAIVYQVSGHDFLMVLAEERGGQPLGLKTEREISPDYAMSVVRHVTITGTDRKVNIMCHAATSERCRQVIDQIHFHDQTCHEVSECKGVIGVH